MLQTVQWQTQPCLVVQTQVRMSEPCIDNNNQTNNQSI